ncbi:hypothetical protein EJ02DRAFT_107439 [Clathrospora elynae]|uniref:Uncharacterized protein n=1 Tax=Clathrospora elynae TaxID=706981 RepID=A0A6A5S5K4_9PLEO|nr:hypothetical protein EJ02DRAFT_107439 [Clathrospora elynae]
MSLFTADALLQRIHRKRIQPLLSEYLKLNPVLKNRHPSSLAMEADRPNIYLPDELLVETFRHNLCFGLALATQDKKIPVHTREVQVRRRPLPLALTSKKFRALTNEHYYTTNEFMIACSASPNFQVSILTTSSSDICQPRYSRVPRGAP